MTAKEMIPAVGAVVVVRVEDVLMVNCKVVDVKTAWGRPRLLVTPVAGSGRQWVDLSRVAGLVSCCAGGAFHSSNCPEVRS